MGYITALNTGVPRWDPNFGNYPHWELPTWIDKGSVLLPQDYSESAISCQSLGFGARIFKTQFAEARFHVGLAEGSHACRPHN